MKTRINVTKTHLPPLEKFQAMVGDIWESGQLTNYGMKSTELQKNLRQHLGVKHLILASNGTIAIQLAIKALNLTGEIITTPFSYVATVSSIVWEGCQPVFVDIDRKTLCLDPEKIESAITERTSAILATHVYGNPCDVMRIQAIADKHGLKVIYDAAHAFDVKVYGQSILNFGDVSTLSFHATKVFHSGEGGAVVATDDEIVHRLNYLGNFGHKDQEQFWGLGINAKMSELHAAIGLLVLPRIGEIIARRKECAEWYDNLLDKNENIELVRFAQSDQHNYSYYPVIFKSENALLKVRDAMNKQDIYPRRYFYPSLNKLPYVSDNGNLKTAEDISKRILCLPLSAELTQVEVELICSIVLKNVN